MGIERIVRRSQTITPFGVGSIYDFGSESFVAMDTTKWWKGDLDIRLPRLERVLRVNGFRAAPAAGSSAFQGAKRRGVRVPYYRFPSWLFCPRCRAMVKWSPRMETNSQHPYCKSCGKKYLLAPMRFMAVCKGGHLLDIPWAKWAHIGSRKRCENHNLIFKSNPDKGAGLQSLSIECLTCDSSNDLGRLPFKDSLVGLIGSCPGTHPWQNSEFSEPCDHFPQVVQRGASNAYYPVVVSAIDIRIEQTKDDEVLELIKLHPSWKPLKQIKEHVTGADDPIAISFITQILADDRLASLGVTNKLIWESLQVVEEEFCDPETIDDNLLIDEWNAFINPPKPSESPAFMLVHHSFCNFA